MLATQDLVNRLGSGNLASEGGFPDLDADVRSNYLMNSTVMGIESADLVLLIGTNPRLEAPVFNARSAARNILMHAELLIHKLLFYMRSAQPTKKHLL